jgi:predicted transglutaminase-like cysteine proteinase
MNPIYDEIFYKVMSHFIWVRDKDSHPNAYDHWQSFADEIERGEIVKGDCDNSALTCAELIVRAGIDKHVVRIASCQPWAGEMHLVCLSEGWCLDNLQRKVRAWQTMPYTWVSSMRLDEPGVWRKMQP